MEKSKIELKGIKDNREKSYDVGFSKIHILLQTFWVKFLSLKDLYSTFKDRRENF